MISTISAVASEPFTSSVILPHPVLLLAISGFGHDFRQLPKEVFYRTCRHAAIAAARRNIRDDPAARSKLNAVTYGDMASHAGLSTNLNAIADFRASGNADLAYDRAVHADADVMPNLYLIVDLRAFADDRVVHRAAI